MTLIEKVRKEHPDEMNSFDRPVYCPTKYGYAEPPLYCGDIDYGDANKRCTDCWNREISENAGQDIDGDKATDIVQPSKKMPVDYVEESPHILDSGNRREFSTGAVRDIQEGKGRCDLMPLDVVSKAIPYNTYHCAILIAIENFKSAGDVEHLYVALNEFGEVFLKNRYTMFLEVSKHFEDGAKKYGENNWQKGIPVHCYIDSAVRHYLKFLRGDKDENHDRAFAWNIMCAIWTCEHKPELNEYAPK